MMNNIHYNPLDPAGPYCDLLPDNLSKEEIEAYSRFTMRGLLASLLTLIGALAFLALCCVLTSCTTSRDTSYVEQRRITDMMQRMDSLMHQKTVVQQDSAWRETILRQFQSIREKSDTSHFVVTDTAGNVIREKIVINNVREVNSETDRQEREVLMHRLDVQDSTLRVMQQQIQHSDSLLQQRQETVFREVKNPLSWWQQLRIWLGNLVLVALIVAAAIWLLKKKLPWLPFGK